MDSVSNVFSDFVTVSGVFIVNSTDKSLPYENKFLNRCEGFQFFLNTIFLGLLCLFGVAGNTLSIVVLQKDRHNRVPVFLLQSLAVADNVLLGASFIALSIFYGLIPHISQSTQKQTGPYIISYINPIGCAAQSCTIWITVLLAINRYAAVCRPFTSQKWLTMTFARVQVLTVVTVSVLLNVPRMFDEEIKELDKSTSSNCTWINSTWSNSTWDNSSLSNSIWSNSTWKNYSTWREICSGNETTSIHWYFEMIYYHVFYNSVILILPLFLLVGFNVPLVRQMQKSKRQMMKNSLSYSGHQESNITVVMVIIILELIICHTPDRVVQLIRLLFRDKIGKSACPNPIFYAVNFVNLLVMLNSSTDFIVYYVFRQRFRSILRHKVCCLTGSRSESRDMELWNSKTDQALGSPLIRLNSNGCGEKT